MNFTDSMRISGEKAIFLTGDDKNIIEDRMKAGPKKTRVVLKDHDTGEILGEYENKCVITGSILNAGDVFGIDPPIKLPTYNREMDLDNTIESDVDPYNTPIVCLFSVGDSGCGSTPKDVYVVNYKDRIEPALANPSDVSDFTSDMIMPFRWVSPDEDLNEDLRQFYFGRKTFSNLNRIGY